MTKEERMNIAKEHTELMDRMFPSETALTIKASEILEETENETEITVEDLTAEEAIKLYGGGKTMLLNFASYINPGGGFIRGSMAQEEAICHVSNLYNILKSFNNEYQKNHGRTDYFSGEYRNWGIYSPNVKFFIDNEVYTANVITCPAPNATKGIKFCEWYETTLVSRIDFILSNAYSRDNTTLILGAFGCGVFNNEPSLVASIFKRLLCKYNFKKVVFAIPNGENFDKFKFIFNYK